MPRYKLQDCNSLLFPDVLSEQIIPGSFAFALNYLVDSELDLSALDAKFKNDDTGASSHTQPIASSAQLARNTSLTYIPTYSRSLKHLPSSQKRRRSGARKRGWSSSRGLQVNQRLGLSFPEAAAVARCAGRGPAWASKVVPASSTSPTWMQVSCACCSCIPRRLRTTSQATF